MSGEAILAGQKMSRRLNKTVVRAVHIIGKILFPLGKILTSTSMWNIFSFLVMETLLISSNVLNVLDSTD